MAWSDEQEVYDGLDEALKKLKSLSSWGSIQTRIEEAISDIEAAMEQFTICESCDHVVEPGTLLCPDCQDDAIAETYK